MSHTPGPWKWDGNVCDYDPEQEAPWLVLDPDSSTTDPILRGEIHCGNPANARLIAAAPDLLEALRGLLADVQEYQTINHLGGENNHRQVFARAAIAKATGEQK